MTVLLGAIADDFTQVIGLPDGSAEIGDAQAVVVALKSRTNAADEAVRWRCRKQTLRLR
jgi:hypothetical protein